MTCRKTAVTARRVALQLIHNTVVCAPDGLRDQLRNMTRMQLIRTLASWRPDLTAYRDVEMAYRITLKSLARRYLELHDEIADLDAMIAAIVDELAPNLVARNSIGHAGAASFSSRPATIRRDCGLKPASHPYAASAQFRRRPERPSGIGSTVEEIAPPIARCTSSPSVACEPTRGPRTTSLAELAEGHSKLDAIRALKRYLAREVFTLITQRRKEINATRIAA